jgi:hypothetical protein
MCHLSPLEFLPDDEIPGTGEEISGRLLAGWKTILHLES